LHGPQSYGQPALTSCACTGGVSETPCAMVLSYQAADVERRTRSRPWVAQFFRKKICSSERTISAGTVFLHIRQMLVVVRNVSSAEFDVPSAMTLPTPQLTGSDCRASHFRTSQSEENIKKLAKPIFTSQVAHNAVDQRSTGAHARWARLIFRTGGVN
jgi:hypothetical protein